MNIVSLLVSSENSSLTSVELLFQSCKFSPFSGFCMYESPWIPVRPQEKSIRHAKLGVARPAKQRAEPPSVLRIPCPIRELGEV